MDQSDGHDGRRHPRDLRRGRPAPHLRALRRGEAVRPLRARHHRARAQEAPIERSGRLVEILIAATPVRRCSAPGTRPSGSSRRCGSRSTASSPCSSARSPPRSSCSRSAGGSSCSSYQSLEDRIVKRDFAEPTASTAPAGLPVELPEHAPRFRLLVKGAELASDDEIAPQPPRDPVRLRAAERVQGGRMSVPAARRAAPRPAAEERRDGGCGSSDAPARRRRRGCSTRSSHWPARSRSAPRRWRSRC